MRAETVVWRGERYDQAYQPAWSPDGTRIAFSAWRKGGFRDILVVDVATGKVRGAHARSRGRHVAGVVARRHDCCTSTSDRTGHLEHLRVRRSRRADVAGDERARRRVPRRGRRPTASGSRSSRRGAERRLRSVRARARSHDAGCPRATYVDDKPAAGRDPRRRRARSARRGPYRALETLAPQTWTRHARHRGPASATIQTGGSDAVGPARATRSASASTTSTATSNVGASYGYTGLAPGVRVAGGAHARRARRLAHRRRAASRTREEDWSGTLSASASRSSRGRARAGRCRSTTTSTGTGSSGAAGGRCSIRTSACRSCPPTNYVQAGVGARASRSRACAAGRSASAPPTGFDASVALRSTTRRSARRIATSRCRYAADRYRKLWGDTPVLAVRLSRRVARGRLCRGGGFGARRRAGAGRREVDRQLDARGRRSATCAAIRARTVAGNQYHLLNLEYRQELWQHRARPRARCRCTSAASTSALLSDTGTAFDSTFDALEEPAHVGRRGACALDAFFGYFVPGTFEIGYAHGLTSAGIGETWFLLTGSI